MLSAWAKVQWQEEAHMQRRHALTLLGATAGGLALTAALPAAACGLFPQASGLFSQASGWRFLVLRHGEPIGTQRMTFSRRGDDSVVEVAIDIAVDVLGITVFRFTHRAERSEEHTSELQSLMRISYAVFCLNK